MTTTRDILDENVTAFEASTPVDEAIDAIRTSAADAERTVYYAYVLGDEGALSGVASLRELLNADGDTPIGEAATNGVVYVEADDSVDRVATVFSRHKYMALPVIDDNRELIGLVRAGDVIEALDEDASKKVLKTTIRDIEYDPADESTYECFTCGTIVKSTTNPGSCPSCGGDMRHRQTSIE